MDFDMFNLGNIFITRPREAESTDTRQGIRRHETDQEQRKKGEREEKPEAFDTDDSATVTIDALRVFLENFLKSIETQKTDGGKFRADISPQAEKDSPAQNTAPVNVQAAAAAGAYQHVAQKVDKTASPTMSDENAAPILGAADVRTIHQLLADLKPLSERGIEYLTIERSDSFLGSLVAAVAKVK
jgi:hypothetical protein